MSDESKGSSSAGGIGFTGLLTTAFVVLKLTHHIDWSWWWVVSPVWITAALAMLVAAIALFVVAAKGGKP